MNGLIALVGSGEYLPVMDAVDRHLLANCGADGRLPKVVCLPTAAGREGDASVDRWLKMGVEHFSALGAQVHPARVIDRPSADDPQAAARLAEADLVYFSGGDPLYLYQTLQGSRAWQAAETAWARGAVFAGCSAGAMILGASIPDFRSLRFRPLAAFGTLAGAMILPHFDRMTSIRFLTLPLIQSHLPDGGYALGVDENTALVGKLGGEWQVMGARTVSVIERQEIHTYSAGETIRLPA